MKSLRPLFLLSLAALAVSVAPKLSAADADTVDSIQKSFVEPPNNTRPTVRWWWFGPRRGEAAA
jgi:hypothetical protein